VLYDSRVISQYLDCRHSGNRLYPADGPDRWSALRREALADGLLDAALLARYETMLRPEAFRWPEWLNGQMDKINSSLDQMQKDVDNGSDLDAGQIATACALGYLDFRFPDLAWHSSHPALADWFDLFSERASMVATAPTG
jgi:glutathione S-transferase